MSIHFSLRHKRFELARISHMNRIYASNSPGQPPKRPTVLPLEEVGTVVAERQTQKPKPPPMCQVLMLNDDFTPMEFVVDVLEHIFGMDRTTATRVMLEVHTRGKGVCGVFTYEIAETKVTQTVDYARKNQHPLQCTLEKE